jgi:hypothetical protein
VRDVKSQHNQIRGCCVNFQLDKLNDLSGKILSHISQGVKGHKRSGIGGKKAGDRSKSSSGKLKK